MRRWFPLGSVTVLAAVTCFVVLPGCSEDGGRRNKPTPDGKKEVKKSSGEMKELASQGWGTVRGKLVYDGTPPPLQPIAAMKNSPDAAMCLAGTEIEKVSQNWIVGADGGVANAVFFVVPPENTFFKIRDEDKKQGEVKINQPHCAYMPHVVTLFPKYIDAKTGSYVPTGQTLNVFNDAPKTHNVKTALGGSVFNVSLDPGKGKIFKNELDPASKPYTIECSIHGWMQAYLWTLDHPYVAVTKSDGTFEFAAPAGTEIYLVGWHESNPFFYAGQQGKAIQVEEGQRLELGNITVAAK